MNVNANERQIADVLRYLTSWFDGGGSHVSREEIEEVTKLPADVVQRALDELHDDGLVHAVVAAGRGRPTGVSHVLRLTPAGRRAGRQLPAG